MWNALRGERSRRSAAPTLAEGIAVKKVGRLTLPRSCANSSPTSCWSTSRISSARSTPTRRCRRPMAEGAGAAGLAAHAGRSRAVSRQEGRARFCRGGNIDPRILASIMVRELERESRIVSFRLDHPTSPACSAPIASRLGELGANILEVDHRRLFLDVPAKGAKHRRHRRDARRRACRGDSQQRSPPTATSRRASRPAATE